MMSIEDTLKLHRGKRHMYMNVAKRARINVRRWDERCKVRAVWGKWDLYEQVLKKFVFHHGAMVCFLRHARAANRKLVQVKRLQRMLSSPNNWDGWI
jgi:hypothetical protein